MKIRDQILLLSLLFFAPFAWSQTISHVQQFPMHFNPGFAGDSAGGRIAMSLSSFGNYGDSAIAQKKWYETQTLAIAYDALWRKLGYGIELVGANKAYQTKSKDDYKGVKLCFSPKFTGLRKGRQKKYTFAPSINFAYLLTSNNRDVGYNYYQNGYSTHSTSYFSDPLIWPTSSYHFGLGLLYQSKHTSLGLSADFRSNTLTQRNPYRQVAYDYNPKDTTKQGRINEKQAISGAPLQWNENTSIKWRDVIVNAFFSQHWSGAGNKLSFRFYGNASVAIPSGGKLPNAQSTYLLAGFSLKYKHLLIGIQPGSWSIEYDWFYIGYETFKARIMEGINPYTRLGKGEVSGTISLNIFLGKHEKLTRI